jgi:hypothetical protein
MTIDKTTVYFTAFSADVPGGFVMDFRHAATGIVLNMAEASLLSDLPEEMTLRSHPGLPGRAAWLWSGGNILQASMKMRRAGFAASAEELANPREVPPKPAPKAERKAGDGPFVQLAPGVVMDMSGMMPSTEPQEPLVLENIAYELKVSDGKVWVGLAETYPDYPEATPEDIYREMSDEPIWQDLKQVIDETSHPSGCFVSKFDEGETIRRLEALGLTRSSKIVLWYDPEELDFNVSDVAGEEVDDCYTIFVIPKDENARFFDDLRCGHLKEKPPYFDGNLLENTWSLKPDANRDDVIADMIARGYTHDKDLDLY